MKNTQNLKWKNGKNEIEIYYLKMIDETTALVYLKNKIPFNSFLNDKFEKDEPIIVDISEIVD